MRAMDIALVTARVAPRLISATAVRSFFLAAIACGIVAGAVLGNGADSVAAVQAAGADFTRLMRAMAVLKALMACGAGAAVWWRLGAATPPAWLVAYAAAGGAMAAGVPLIWGMVHSGPGALALHGGLAASILLLWRDRAVGQRLAQAIEARRAR